MTKQKGKKKTITARNANMRANGANIEKREK
jgi:hypothetical protein